MVRLYLRHSQLKKIESCLTFKILKVQLLKNEDQG